MQLSVQLLQEHSVLQHFRGSALIAVEWLFYRSHLFTLICCCATLKKSVMSECLIENKFILKTGMNYVSQLCYNIMIQINTHWLFLLGQSQTQCTPMPLPTLGTQKIIQGNGTSVGTVISLQCPAKHTLVGSDLTCVMGGNSSYWVGKTYCKRK